MSKPPSRPRTRADCVDAPRPCPWVGCRHHLYLDVTKAGGLRINFPDLDFDEIPECCALDIAEHGGITLDQVGQALNITRERVRQIELKARNILKRRPATAELRRLAQHCEEAREALKDGEAI